MEDFGDILFYVIAAVIAIIGAIVNKKKKQAERQMTQPGMPDQEEETDYSDREEEISYPEARGATTQYQMIDEDSLETKGTGFKDTAFKSSEEQALKMGAEYEGDYYEPMAKEFASEGESVTDVSVSQSELGTGSEMLGEEENSWARKLIDEFNLPEAIVYSEILKPKDFV
ncbi:MAG: hypothetical protein U9N72_06340 [Bacteroidota bacterium]|nr:hypothetical protein [Bacteroidota bacterium]